FNLLRFIKPPRKAFQCLKISHPRVGKAIRGLIPSQLNVSRGFSPNGRSQFPSQFHGCVASLRRFDGGSRQSRYLPELGASPHPPLYNLPAAQPAAPSPSDARAPASANSHELEPAP